jgi:hypothetical protein
MKVKTLPPKYSAPLQAVDNGKAVSEALKPLDRVARDLETKWGCGRLPRLVTPELASRFGSAVDRLNAAIYENDAEAVAHRAGVLIRGWEALDKAATDSGAPVMPEAVWSVKQRGQVFTIVRDQADVDKVARASDDPGRVVTVAELLTVWDDFQARRFVAEVKEVFPGATVKRAGEALNDEIPF